MVVSSQAEAASLCGDGQDVQEAVMSNLDEHPEVPVSGATGADDEMNMDVDLHLKHQIFCSTSMITSSKYPQDSLPECEPFHRHLLHSVCMEEMYNISKQPMPCLPLSPEVDLHEAITEAVALEPKYQPALTLVMPARSDNEISGYMRNSSCHVLRFLKMWYELPSDALFLAINIIDRFLTRMKALPKHLSCIAVSAFHVACEELSAASGIAAPSRESVSHISQSKCKSGDVQRMEDIIRTKLELGMHIPEFNLTRPRRTWRIMGANSNPVTSLTFLKLLYAGLEQLRDRHFPDLSLPPLASLVNKLEVVACDTRTTNFRPSELAVALLRRDLISLAKTDAAAVAARTACLQPLITLCKVNSDVLCKIEDLITMLLCNYEDNKSGKTSMAVFQRQRLVWRLSNRTMRHLKIIYKYKKQRKLTSIEEDDKAAEELELWTPTVLADNSGKNSSICLDLDEQNLASSVPSDISEPADDTRNSCGAPEMSDDEMATEETSPMESDAEIVNTPTTSGDVCVVSEEESMDMSDAEVDESDVEEESSEEQEKMDEDIHQHVKESNNKPSTETVAHSRAAAAAAGYHSDKEESYCQVAKKIKEDKPHLQSPRLETSRAIVGDEILRSRMRSFVRTSPPSKITLTPVLPQPSSAVRNLTPLLQGNSYRYARPRALSVLGIESIDGEVNEQQLLPLVGVNTNISFSSSRKNIKRKKFLRHLARARNEGSDTDMSLEQTSSEEEMDSDYEKEFPPLPVPRPALARMSSIGKKPVALKKKKKKSDAMPYVAKNKAMSVHRIAVN